MLRALKFRTRYGSYLRNPDGIKKFAEMAMGQLTRRVTKKAAFFREMNENLLVEKANLRMRADELFEKPMLDASDFFSTRRKLLSFSGLVFITLVASVFLNYLSISAFITEGTTTSGFLRWFTSGVLALVLTGGGILTAEQLIDALLGHRKPTTEHLAEANKAVVPLWAILLIGIELALLGLAELRADQLSTDSAILYYGYIVLSMMLPVVAGAFRWMSMQYIDLYKSTQALRQIEGRLAQIDSILRQNEESESNSFKTNTATYWDLLNEFKTYKDNYNQKKGIEERTNGHFSQSFDQFQTEAHKRYQADIRDYTTKSIRKLELVDQDRPVGTKLGQAEKSLPASDGHSGKAAEDPEIYLNPQPIR